MLFMQADTVTVKGPTTTVEETINRDKEVDFFLEKLQAMEGEANP